MAASNDRAALGGLEKRLFQLVSKRATAGQWAEWLRVPLEHALAEGDKDLTLTLLKAGADGGAGWEGCNGRTLLIAAAEGGSEEMVSTLLEAGGMEELDASSGDDEMTALHRALAGGHADVSSVLMLAGADASLTDDRGRSALHYAIEGGHLQLAGTAVIGGADVNKKDNEGNTPLHLAAAHDDAKFVCTLLRRGARVNKANKEGACPIHVAVKRDRIAVAEALLKAGADPNSRYGPCNKVSPLSLARNSPEMTEILLRYNANVNSCDEIGFTALHRAGPMTIELLLGAGADIEARTSTGVYNADTDREFHFKGLTPLHVATFVRWRSAMGVLLQSGADTNALSDNGLTPLHVLCCTSHAAFAHSDAEAKLLLRWGADETVTDNDGRTPKALIKGRSRKSKVLRQVLDNAPADRAWRRRGFLVMCRAHPEKILTKGGRRASKARARAGRGRGGGRVGRGRGTESMFARVVEMEDDELFRMIIAFL